MRRVLLVAGLALFAVGVLSHTPALTQGASAAKTEDAKPAKPAAKSVRHPMSKDGRPLSTKSAAARTALCKADCRPNNYKDCGTWGCVGMHGLYRDYNKYDPQLKSIAGQKAYKQCVEKCVGPLPSIYIQRAVFGAGITSWFGKSKESCLDCHSMGH
jgi:hypothetical protein